MNPWDEEFDLNSQDAVERCCFKIREANVLLTEAHAEMTDSLPDKAKRIILSEVEVTEEITHDMRATYFRYHTQQKIKRIMEGLEKMVTPEKEQDE